MVDYFAEAAAEDAGDQSHARLGRAGRHARDQAAWPARWACRRSCSPTPPDVLDAPQTGKHVFYPHGGATVEALRPDRRQPGHLRPRARAPPRPPRGSWKPSARSAARVLELPMGLRATDRFIDTLRRKWPTCKCPDEIT